MVLVLITEFITEFVSTFLQGAEYIWGPSALFGSVALVSAVLTLRLPETRHLNLTALESLEDAEEKRNEESKGTGKDASVAKIKLLYYYH